MKRLILIFGLGVFVLIAKSQTVSPELISSAGDSFNNTSYQLDWSIGELVTETYTGTQNTLTQGFHQENTYIVTNIDENPLLEFSIVAFPNPTSDLICLKVENEKFNEMQYFITDISGKVLQNGKFANETEQINFSNYAVGTYLITISQNNQFVKSFQIIKK